MEVDEIYPCTRITEEEYKFHEEYTKMTSLLEDNKTILYNGVVVQLSNIRDRELITEVLPMQHKHNVGILKDERLTVLKKELEKRLLIKF